MPFRSYMSFMPPELVNRFRDEMFKRDSAESASIVLPADAFRRGAIAPTVDTLGSTPTVGTQRFSATNELLSCTLYMPLTWNRRAIVLSFLWALEDTQIAGDTFDLSLDCSFNELGPGLGLLKANQTLTSGFTCSEEQGLAQGDLYLVDFTLNALNTTLNPSTLGISFEIHMTNTDEVAEAHFIGGNAHYNMAH